MCSCSPTSMVGLSPKTVGLGRRQIGECAAIPGTVGHPSGPTMMSMTSGLLHRPLAIGP
jgi:hypothetical protein